MYHGYCAGNGNKVQYNKKMNGAKRKHTHDLCNDFFNKC